MVKRPKKADFEANAKRNYFEANAIFALIGLFNFWLFNYKYDLRENSDFRGHQDTCSEGSIGNVLSIIANIAHCFCFFVCFQFSSARSVCSHYYPQSLKMERDGENEIN